METLIFEDYFPQRVYADCILNAFLNSCELVKLVARSCFKYLSGHQQKFIN